MGQSQNTYNCREQLPKKSDVVIEKWISFHNPGEVANEFREHLQQLFDFAPKPHGKGTYEAQLAHLKELMTQACRCRNFEGHRYSWEIDF